MKINPSRLAPIKCTRRNLSSGRESKHQVRSFNVGGYEGDGSGMDLRFTQLNHEYVWEVPRERLKDLRDAISKFLDATEADYYRQLAKDIHDQD